MIILSIIVWFICGVMSLRLWQNIADSLDDNLVEDWFDIFFIFVVLITGPIGLLITLYARNIK